VAADFHAFRTGRTPYRLRAARRPGTGATAASMLRTVAFRRPLDYVLAQSGACAERNKGPEGKPMTFSEAVKSGFDHYTKFDGRASKAAFWWWFLFGVLVAIVANILDAIIGSSIISILVALALLLPNLSVAIRRLHDTDRTGWWILIGLIPIVGFIVLLIFYLEKSNPGENKYGPEPVNGVSAPTVA
jgi:uncharacterized membrane protein YhaH (DUF805 family)